MKTFKQIITIFLSFYLKQTLEELKKKLTHQWDFIRLQADAQIKFFFI
jgi:hypothetical protein